MISCLFLFYHGFIPPFHFLSISSGSFYPVCFCVLFSISSGGILPLVVCGMFVSGRWLSGLECDFTSYVGAFLWAIDIDFLFSSFPLDNLCVIFSIHDTLLISVASVSSGRCNSCLRERCRPAQQPIELTVGGLIQSYFLWFFDKA